MFSGFLTEVYVHQATEGYVNSIQKDSRATIFKGNARKEVDGTRKIKTKMMKVTAKATIKLRKKIIIISEAFHLLVQLEFLYIAKYSVRMGRETALISHA